MTMYNPSVREEPRHRPAAVIPLPQESSILDWLEANGRLLARDNQDDVFNLDEEEEINDLIGVEDSMYEDDEILDDGDLDLDE